MERFFHVVRFEPHARRMRTLLLLRSNLRSCRASKSSRVHVIRDVGGALQILLNVPEPERARDSTAPWVLPREPGAYVEDGRSATMSSAVRQEGAEDLSILSVTAKAAPGSDLEGGHEAAADSLDCAGHISTGSDQGNFEEECEMHPQLSRDYTDDDNGIDEGTRGLEDGLDDGLDEEEDEDCLKGERQQGDGEESVDPSNIQDKVLDFDEDKRNPQYIPKKGAFYQHDDRMVGDEDGSEVLEEKNEDDK
ncbi:hypothetical protein HPB50_023126 [Hyalomma asiaticum]|uniref:Uncharacterized protein n=1 Tax=Hyalomma asiaticum TaxID=266040 RepID=A0ACB7TPL9_HYAAI|nr:hypothetical protein HPB50_023126 [Hyalomma asiaticum]